jgi:hypothetical protein
MNHRTLIDIVGTGDYVGVRVEIPVHYDWWMRGARCGRISSVGAGFVRVAMDHPRVRRRVKVPFGDFPLTKLI